MDISGSVVLVTGANRGIGAEFVTQLRARGALKVYAGARNPASIQVDGVEPVRLDVTDADQVAAAARRAADVQIVINNAGVMRGQDFARGDLEEIRLEFETNFFGPLRVAQAFAPVLGANGGGAILNTLSALSWFAYPGSGGYSASKAAAWMLTDGLRVELAGQGTQVVALHMGAVDTEMLAGWDVPKLAPATVVGAALDGIASGASEVLVDDTARRFKASLTADPAARYAGVLRSSG